MQKEAKNILIHLVSWCVLIVVPHLFVINAFSLSLFCFHTTLYVAPIIIFYLHLEVVLPVLFARGRYGTYFLMLLALGVLFFFHFLAFGSTSREVDGYGTFHESVNCLYTREDKDSGSIHSFLRITSGKWRTQLLDSGSKTRAVNARVGGATCRIQFATSEIAT